MTETPALPKRVAIVANRYTDFRRPIIDHMAAQLNVAGYGVVCVTGRDLQRNFTAPKGGVRRTPATGTATTELTCNAIYTEAADFEVCGYIVIAVTLGYEASSQNIIDVIQRYSDKPVVSFGLDVPNVPSVVMDQVGAMRRVVEHVADNPANQRIAFLRGYPEMDDAIQRETAFRDVLAERGLGVDERLMLTGNFLTAMSYRVVKEVLSEHNKPFDAIVASNDLMAISAMHALHEAGLRVPDDVTVTGFDDRPEASQAIPPLTTVRYSFLARAQWAVQALLHQLDDTAPVPAAPDAIDDGCLIIRASSDASLLQTDQDAIKVSYEQAQASWAEQDRQRYQDQKSQRLQDDLYIDLATCTNQAGIRDAVATTLKQLGCQRAYLILYDTPGSLPARLATATTIVHHGGTDVQHSETFATEALLPPSLEQELATGLLVMLPLCSLTTNFGYLMVDPVGSRQFHLDNLASNVSSALFSSHLINTLEQRNDALQESNKELARLANFDPLTGLANRHRFKQKMTAALEQATARNASLDVMIFDLDGFKLINDTYGHDTGDQVLRVVAERLPGVLRREDLAARLGGDEFAVLATINGNSERSEHDAIHLAQRILDTLSMPFSLNERTVILSASIGIAQFPRDGNDVETLLKHADTAMYDAKGSGRNRFSLYEAAMNESARFSLQVDQALRRSLVEGGFDVFFQPRVDIDTGTFNAFEALIRWPGCPPGLPDGSASPEYFIPIAERSGLVTELDTLVLDRVCAQLRFWRTLGLYAHVAVNMSIAQLQQESIIDTVAFSLIRHGIDPAQLELEVTESAMMSDIDLNRRTLRALRRLGIQVAIDDFGTGHSSLNYLKNLPVDSLKIDRSFIKDLDETTDPLSADKAIIEAVTALGRGMGLKVVAEGVETEFQRRYLASIGCDDGQGWLFGQPMHHEQATEYLRTHTATALAGDSATQ